MTSPNKRTVAPPASPPPPPSSNPARTDDEQQNVVTRESMPGPAPRPAPRQAAPAPAPAGRELARQPDQYQPAESLTDMFADMLNNGAGNGRGGPTHDEPVIPLSRAMAPKPIPLDKCTEPVAGRIPAYVKDAWGFYLRMTGQQAQEELRDALIAHMEARGAGQLLDQAYRNRAGDKTAVRPSAQ